MSWGKGGRCHMAYIAKHFTEAYVVRNDRGNTFALKLVFSIVWPKVLAVVNLVFCMHCKLINVTKAKE